MREIARHMAELPKENDKRKRTVVITQGTEPTVVAVQGEQDVKEYEVHEIAKEKICDTTGAGYVFVTFFLALSPPFSLSPIPPSLLTLNNFPSPLPSSSLLFFSSQKNKKTKI